MKYMEPIVLGVIDVSPPDECYDCAGVKSDLVAERDGVHGFDVLEGHPGVNGQ